MRRKFESTMRRPNSLFRVGGQNKVNTIPDASNDKPDEKTLFIPKLKHPESICTIEDHRVHAADPYQRFSLSNVMGLREREKYIVSVQDILRYLAGQKVCENCPVTPRGVTFYLKPINYQRLTCEEIDKILQDKYGTIQSSTKEPVLNLPEGKTYEELKSELIQEEEEALERHVQSLVKCRYCKEGGISKRVGNCRYATRIIFRIFTLNWAVTDSYFLASRKRTFFVGIMVFTLLTNLGQRFEAHPFYTKEFWESLGTWLQSIFYLFFIIIIVLVTKMIELLVFYIFTTTEQRLRRQRLRNLEEQAAETDNQYISVADGYWSTIEEEDEEPDPTSSDPDIWYINKILKPSRKLPHHRYEFKKEPLPRKSRRKCCRWLCC